MIDADGRVLGVYRKTHIPDDHYYQEKFYFTPGNTGFRVWDTRYGKIGVGICWDQWFPEAARCMALLGADLLLYPTAIGSEPILEVDSAGHWQRAMQGHSAANVVPVVAANRYGLERVTPCPENGGQTSALQFYGSSFLTDETGAILQQAGARKRRRAVRTVRFCRDPGGAAFLGDVPRPPAGVLWRDLRINSCSSLLRGLINLYIRLFCFYWSIERVRGEFHEQAKTYMGYSASLSFRFHHFYRLSSKRGYILPKYRKESCLCEFIGHPIYPR